MTKHKHAEMIHAWADGVEIQVKSTADDEVWLDAQWPTWAPEREYRIKPAVSYPKGYTAWGGGCCPVGVGVLVDVIYRDGTYKYRLAANQDPHPSSTFSTERNAAHRFWLNHGTPNDIVAYRPSKIVVRWQWIYKRARIELTAGFYRTREEALNHLAGCEIIGPAPWTRMEFDE